jgi:hypothetical protein
MCGKHKSLRAYEIIYKIPQSLKIHFIYLFEVYIILRKFPYVLTDS